MWEKKFSKNSTRRFRWGARAWVKMHTLNAFSRNANTINWKVFPTHDGIYKHSGEIIGVSRKFRLHFTLMLLAKILQNGATFIPKLNPGFKNHLRNLDNFRQALESLKRVNLMGNFCSKNKFVQKIHSFS